MLEHAASAVSALICALILCACAASEPPPSASPVVTTEAPPPGLADGTYLLQTDTECPSPLNGLTVDIADGTAVLVGGAGSLGTDGPVTVDGTSVGIALTVHGSNSGASVTLNGTLDANGVVSGRGQELFSGDVGCDFGFTLSPPAPADSELPDGDYILHERNTTCPTSHDGKVVTIADGNATFPLDAATTLSGPVSMDGSDVTIELPNDPDGLTLEGTRYAGDVIAGTGQGGGVLGVGEIGYVCGFDFVMTPAPPKPAAGEGVDCSQAAFQAAADAVMPEDHPKVGDQFVCSGDWAAVGVGVHDGEAQITAVFHVENGEWTRKDRHAECDAGTIPADIVDLACNSN